MYLRLWYAATFVVYLFIYLFVLSSQPCWYAQEKKTTKNSSNLTYSKPIVRLSTSVVI